MVVKVGEQLLVLAKLLLEPGAIVGIEHRDVPASCVLRIAHHRRWYRSTNGLLARS